MRIKIDMLKIELTKNPDKMSNSNSVGKYSQNNVAKNQKNTTYAEIMEIQLVDITKECEF